MRYEILDGRTVVNRIRADAAFMLAHYPAGNYREVITPVDAPAQKRAAILARLAEIDATGSKPRTQRELSLGNASTKVWLQALDDEATTLRATLHTL